MSKRLMTAILTDEQIVTLLATDGGREEMLQEAARMERDRILGICEQMRLPELDDFSAKGWNAAIDTTVIAIRAAVGE